MSDTISISVSAAAIFCSEEGCGRPPNREKDMLAGLWREATGGKCGGRRGVAGWLLDAQVGVAMDGGGLAL